MKKVKLYIPFALFLIFHSCSASKHESTLSCSRQYSYKLSKVDIKGISAKLKKAGVEYADFGVTDITIDPKQIIASEKLQQLDMLQFSVCQQIKSLSNDSLTLTLKTKYVNALIEMMKIAQTQDSLSKK